MALEEPKLEAGRDAEGLTKGFVFWPFGRNEEAPSAPSPNGLRLPSVFGVPGRSGVWLSEVVCDMAG